MVCEWLFSEIFPHYGKKGRKVKVSISKNKYIATGTLEMIKPFAFSFFQHLDLVVSQI